MIRILVADDHPIVRHGIGQILASAGDMVIAGEAADGRQLLEQARTVAHDLVLLDLSMPATDGVEALKQLKRERPAIPVVILTLHPEEQFAIRALKAGASGYLTKECAVAELVDAVRKAASGGRYLTPRVVEQLADHLLDHVEQPLHDRLSDREYQVLRMIAAGKSTRQISADLALSVKTVCTYRARIFEKMQMKNIADLAAYVVRHHLAD